MHVKAHAFENKMAACFNDMKDEESFVRWTRKLSMQFFEQQPEGKVVFKSKFSHELGEMKENLKAWPYLLELAAPTNKLRIWDQK